MSSKNSATQYPLNQRTARTRLQTVKAEVSACFASLSDNLDPVQHGKPVLLSCVSTPSSAGVTMELRAWFLRTLSLYTLAVVISGDDSLPGAWFE